jgi:hypothetical protein
MNVPESRTEAPPRDPPSKLASRKLRATIGNGPVGRRFASGVVLSP